MANKFKPGDKVVLRGKHLYNGHHYKTEGEDGDTATVIANRYGTLETDVASVQWDKWANDPDDPDRYSNIDEVCLELISVTEEELEYVRRSLMGEIDA